MTEVSLDTVRAILEQEAIIKQGVDMINQASLKLRSLGDHGVKLTCWDFNKPSYEASIFVQGGMSVSIATNADRPAR